MTTEIVPAFYRLGYGIKRVLDDNAEKITNYRKIYSKINKDKKITNQQVIILLFLYIHPDSTLSAIAENMNREPPNIVIQLNNLEKMKLIKKTRNSTDRRIVSINLTSTGRKFVQEKPVSLSDTVSLQLNSMDKESQAKVIEAITILQTTLNTIGPDLFNAVDEYHQT